jgi:superfamily I DNA/RNA helicase
VLAEYQRASATSWSTSTRTPTSRSICGCGLLAQGRRNICCVGDDDQSIYGWRGAEVDNILRFEKDFPGAKVIRLERNYRSTGHILAAASHLIAHNEGRLGKTLFTERRPGEKVTVTGAWDSEEERAPSARRSSSCSARATRSNEIAILVRASFQMREFEDRFVTLGLPYRVIGGPRFYERAGNPRRAGLSARRRPAGRRPRLRAHRQRAQARPRRRHRASCCTTTPARRMPLLEAARASSRPTS